MKYFKPLFFALLLIVFNACTDDDKPIDQVFVVGFQNQSLNYSKIIDQQKVELEFSKAAEDDGVVMIEIVETAAEYAVDYETLPSANNRMIQLDFKKGDQKLSFDFINLIFPFDRSDKVIEFKIKEILYSKASAIQGYTSLTVNFEASIGSTLSPQIGGPNQPYQVFVDLSKEDMHRVKRDSWDLGFYSGEDFRVVLNGSLYMAAKKLDAFDIDAVTESQVSPFYSTVAVGTFVASNEEFIDYPTGELHRTAIAEVQDDDAQNSVYLINLGYEIGTDTPPIGSVAIAGDHRGWMKIRILKRENHYVLQYAKVNEATHQTIEIQKNELYNFSFFSLVNNQPLQVEPEKQNWDLSFTVFTNIIDGSGSYGYSDFVTNNLKNNVKGYRVTVTNEVKYETFAAGQIDETKFIDDQRVIGANWRDVFTGTASTDRFFVFKDTDGNYYKVRMLGFLNSAGERGYPRFEYQLLK